MANQLNVPKQPTPISNFYIYCDGGARGNPGPAAASFVVKDQNGKLIWKEGFYLGKTTNNAAEYQAVIKALDWLAVYQANIQYPISNIQFYLDSLLVVNQLNGVFKIKNSNLAELILKIKALENQLAVDIFYKHILRDKNQEADKIVNDTLDKISLSGKMNNRDCHAHNFQKTPRFDI